MMAASWKNEVSVDRSTQAAGISGPTDADRIVDEARLHRCLAHIDYLSADEKRSLPPHVFSQLRETGVFSMSAPREIGGLGYCLEDMVSVVCTISQYDLSIAVLVSLHNLLSAPAIYAYGKSVMSEDDLKRVASGEDLVAYGLTEPDAGSDPRRIRASALFSADRLSVTLNGQKCWTGLGAWSTYIVFFAQCESPDGSRLGITAFLLKTREDKLSYQGEHLTMGLRSVIQNAFKVSDVMIPTERSLGTIGNGLDIAKERMAYGRMAVAAMSCGPLERCIDVVAAFGTDRHVSTGLLAYNAAWCLLLDEARFCLIVARRVVEFALHLAGRLPSEAHVAFTLAKIVNSTLCHHGINLLVQAFGGRGYDEALTVARFFRDSRVLSIFEGSNGALLHFVGKTMLHWSRREVVSALPFLTLCRLDASLLEELRNRSDRGDAASKQHAAYEAGLLASQHFARAAIPEVVAHGSGPTALLDSILAKSLYNRELVRPIQDLVRHLEGSLRPDHQSKHSLAPPSPMNFTWA